MKEQARFQDCLRLYVPPINLQFAHRYPLIRAGHQGPGRTALPDGAGSAIAFLMRAPCFDDANLAMIPRHGRKTPRRWERRIVACPDEVNDLVCPAIPQESSTFWYLLTEIF